MKYNNIKFLLLGVYLLLLTNCSTKILDGISYQGAFFLNDSTLGVVAWEYKYHPNGGPGDMPYAFDGIQRYYHYNINTKALSTVTELRRVDGIFGNSVGSVKFTPPFFVATSYGSNGDKNDILIYNVETTEKEILSQGGTPVGVSPNGGYIMTESGVYNRSTKEMVYKQFSQPENITSYFIDSSEEKLYGALADANGPSWRKWLCSYTFASGEIDTIRLFDNEERHEYFDILTSSNDVVYHDVYKGTFYSSKSDYASGNIDDAMQITPKFVELTDANNSLTHFVKGRGSITVGTFNPYSETVILNKEVK